MRHLLTAVIAAIEACAVALAGLVLVSIPAVLLWAVTFGLSAEPAVVVEAVAGSWLLAQLSPLRINLSDETALSLGLAAEPLQFTLSLAPLGLTLVTVLLALRAGWRFAGRGSIGAAGVLGGAIGFAAAVTGITMLAGDLPAWPIWLTVLVPTLLYAVTSGLAFTIRAAQTGHGWWRFAVRATLRELERLGLSLASALPGYMRAMLRLAAAALAATVGLGAVGFAVTLLLGYTRVMSLSQGLHLDPLGAALLFLMQLAFVPVAVVWAVSWFSGAGFSIGEGTTVSPFETFLGPLPPVPFFGALPEAWGAFGAAAPLCVLLLGLVLGFTAAPVSVARGGHPVAAAGPVVAPRNSLLASLFVSIGAAVLAGGAVAGLVTLAQGSIGPGRFEETGAHPLIVGGLISAEIAVGVLLGRLAKRVDRSKLPGWLSPSEAQAVPGSAEASREADTVPLTPLPSMLTPVPVPGPERDDTRVPDLDDTPVLAPVITLPVTENSDPEPPLAEQETAPIDPLPRPEPELFDRVQTETAAAAAEAPQADDLDAENDELLRAYSWEQAPVQAEESTRGRRGWRPPWRRG